VLTPDIFYKLFATALVVFVCLNCS